VVDGMDEARELAAWTPGLSTVRASTMSLIALQLTPLSSYTWTPNASVQISFSGSSSSTGIRTPD
jgi:hypothetical protein